MIRRKKMAGRWLMYLGVVGGATAFCTGIIGCLWRESLLKYTGLGALVAGFVFLFLWAGERALRALLGSGQAELVRADIRDHTKKRLLEAAASFDVLSGVFDGVTEETAEEFQPYYDLIFTESLWESVMVNRYDQERSDLIAGRGMVAAAGGAIWFAEMEEGQVFILIVHNSEDRSVVQGGA